MIQVKEKDLQILVELADRAPKTKGEQYALAAIVAEINEQVKPKNETPQPSS